MGRCESTVSFNILRSYIETDIKINVVTCESVSPADSNARSFKVTVSAADRDKLLDPTLWPVGVCIRKFFRYRSNGISQSGRKNNVCSYNCNSIRKKVDIVRQILVDCDILLLQEIILLNEDTDFLFGLDNNFECHVVPSKSPVSECLDGRPSSGLAVFFRKSPSLSVDIATTHDNYMVASVTCGSWSFALVNVYMPHDDRSRDVVMSYSNILGEIQSSLSDLPTTNILLVGHFNCDPNRGRLWPCIVDFCEFNELCVSDLILPLDSFTYLSPAHTTSWLDHVLSSGDVVIRDLQIRYDLAIFDHFPIVFKLDISGYSVEADSGDNNDGNFISKFVDWNNVDSDVYVSIVENELHGLEICDDFNCVHRHSDAIDSNYDKLIDCLKRGTESNLFYKERKFTPVPGWNSYCKVKYSEARGAFFEWLNVGKVRIGEVFEKMKETRKAFVKSLNYCKANKQKISDEIIADSFYNKRLGSFWNEINKRKPTNKTNCVGEIDGVKDDVLIAKLFHDKFKSISGTVDGIQSDDYVYSNFLPNNRISSRNVREAINSLNDGVGFDGIHANHFKFSSPLMIHVFVKLINSCFIHNYVPSKMLAGVIRPIVKNRAGDLRSSSS